MQYRRRISKGVDGGGGKWRGGGDKGRGGSGVEIGERGWRRMEGDAEEGEDDENEEDEERGGDISPQCSHTPTVQTQEHWINGGIWLGVNTQ